ncbi:type I deoxyribonuclease HsdR [Flavobacterium noncentrifugens]|uniref:Vitamin K-dependent gamma-carboxylase n=1 Tax=Flavobacterium noncentrifugens TaxID=1128970 RepID=A0A1G9AID2_9FLAO|nr:HTTM domain-containing protein [Flavobacterium noncentrifugens]GEP51437.1 type I deoxyribonuclease HsdR [Flavobacterium noncentrifugens]SDK26330.1 Vitamin K-dependent gamma-carboxylase [Flavobacterium noncentrifugens]
MFRKCCKPIDIAPLVIFRIFFGFLLFAETLGAIFTGWVKNVMIDPEFTFSHIGFEWLQPLPGSGMYFYFLAMSLLGFAVMLGYRYRISLGLFTILWAGVYLMQKEAYNNHYYLLLLVCIIMLFLPANRYASLDVKRNSKIQLDAMPQWYSGIMVFQIAIVYFFAVISKLYLQWLDGTFIRLLLGGEHHPEFLRGLFAQHWFHLFIAWSGIAFDLLIVPLLLWKRTRTAAFIAALLFHLFNASVLRIGIFPFFALSFVVFFYPADRIRTIFLRKKPAIQPDDYHFENQVRLLYFFIPYFIVQLSLPLRHYLIKGDVLWTEEGHRLSWRMMLRQRSGSAAYRVVDKKTKEESYYNYQKLNPKQRNFVTTKPDGIWQMAQHIKKEYALQGKDVSVFVNASVSVNAGPSQTFIDPNVDLANAKWNFFDHDEWLLLYQNDK